MTGARKKPMYLDPARNILVRCDELGLNVLSYTNQTTFAHSDGSKYWIPRDAIGHDGKSAILFRAHECGRRDLPGANYGFDGWEVCCEGPFGMMHGGRYRTFEGALAWLQTAMDIRAGRQSHF